MHPQMTQMGTDKNDPQTYAVIGAALEVHKRLGPGFLEAVYQEALSVELTLRGIPHRREAALDVFYKGTRLATAYRADFICFDAVVVETKAIGALGNHDYAQLLNYLKATGHRRGLLLNFGSVRLQYKRMVRGPESTGGDAASHLRSSVSSVDESS